MSECLPTVKDIESVDWCMTGSQTLSKESDEVLLNLAHLLQFDNFLTPTASSNGPLQWNEASAFVIWKDWRSEI